MFLDCDEVGVPMHTLGQHLGCWVSITIPHLQTHNLKLTDNKHLFAGGYLYHSHCEDINVFYSISSASGGITRFNVVLR